MINSVEGIYQVQVSMSLRIMLMGTTVYLNLRTLALGGSVLQQDCSLIKQPLIHQDQVITVLQVTLDI